ncbi:MAG: hypothetical protein ACMUEM_03055 [Flavobacteriales bacterium AspAUS03]
MLVFAKDDVMVIEFLITCIFFYKENECMIKAFSDKYTLLDQMVFEVFELFEQGDPSGVFAHSKP